MREPGAELQDTAYVFDVPPMLRRSWSLVQEATAEAENRDLVPLDSLSMEASRRMWGDGAWHLWQQPADEPEWPAGVAFFDSLADVEVESPMLSASQEFLVAQLEMAREPLQRRERELPEPKIVADMDPSLLEPDDKTVKRLMHVLGMPRAGVEAELEQLGRKARRYEAVRAEMPQGWDRTMQLEKIVTQAREPVSQLDDVTDALQGLIGDDAEGSRITALGILEAQRDPQFFPFLLDAIGYSRSAFEQYHALPAAWKMVPLLNADQKEQLAEVLEDQREEGRGKYIQPDSDRWGLSSRILEDLSYSTSPVH